MRGFATIFLNRNKNEYIVQPAAKGPVSTTDFGEPVRIPANQFNEALSDRVMETILKYQAQVFDRATAKRFSGVEYLAFLKDHLAVGGLAARDGEEIVLHAGDFGRELISAIIEGFGRAG